VAQYVVRDTVADLVRPLGPEPRGGSPLILDVGCGAGGALPLLDLAFSPRALLARDIDAALLHRAAREAAPRCRCPVDLAVASADCLDLRDESIDVVLCHALHLQRRAAGWIGLVRATGFAIDPASVNAPYPWWSRPDFGLREFLGRPAPAPRDPMVVHFIARKR